MVFLLVPVLLGVGIGTGVAVHGVWRWFALTAEGRGRNRIGLLRTVGVQHLGGGLLLTVLFAHVLARGLAAADPLPIVEQALTGLPLGLAAGIYWVYSRGAR
jgi:hypothetical protein